MHWNEETQYGYFTVPSVKEVIMWIVILIGFGIMCHAMLDTTKAEAAERPIAGFTKLMDEYHKVAEPHTQEDLELLANVIYLENGYASEKVKLLTGSVVLNRMKRGWADGTMHGVIYQGYNSKGPQQYATATITRIGKVDVPRDCYLIAGFLLTFGSAAPEKVVYQSMNPHNGSSIYYQEGGEYFGWE